MNKLKLKWMHHVSNMLLQWDLQFSINSHGWYTFVYLMLRYIRQFTKCLFGKATVFNKIPVISQVLQMLCIQNVKFKNIYVYGGATEGML